MDKNTALTGAIGSLLITLSILPYVGVLLNAVGVVLVFVAMKKISAEHPGKGILKDFAIGFVLVLLSSVVLGFGVAGLTATAKQGAIKGLLKVAVLSLTVILFYIIMVAGFFLYRRSFNKVADVTGNNLFSWAGNLFFWGSIATLVLIGIVVVWLGWILLAVAFFNTPVEE